MKGTHMSGRDLIYRDLSCWPTPLHYHPAQCLWPFLFNTVALSASPPAHCLSRHLPQPPIYTSVPLPVSFPMHIIRMCDPTKWICPHIKDSYFFLLEKQKGHAADRMRLVSLRKHAPPTTTTHHRTFLSQVQEKRHHAFLSLPGCFVFKEALKFQSVAQLHTMFCFFFLKKHMVRLVWLQVNANIPSQLCI